ncbi:MAG: adenylosuccinate lyase [Cytophagia bacterium]|jgi:adenylosuccinate lyase|nr:adenylosuccinate lyase [Cytophagia bacterium]
MNSISKSLLSISPVDGRYSNKTFQLQNYFSEFALIKYRVFVEIKYFIELAKNKVKPLNEISENNLKKVEKIIKNFSEDDALRIKEIEKKINHDVKAVEYFIKEEFDKINLKEFKEYIHFGLTSQDINNTAVPLMIKDSLNKVIIPSFENTIKEISEKSISMKNIPMISRTHGQSATPTTFGKEFLVFNERIIKQLDMLKSIPNNGKFGGASGNLNAHYVSYPDIDWDTFSDNFLKSIGLKRSKPTTQIEHYDNMGALFHNVSRINTILIDLCRDIWHYISINYLIQKVNKNEVGSSAMPHKVNPIDFENAEGNLMFANSQFIFLAEKLPISRLQRDLTDSTVSRNIGIPFAHTKIALESIIKGLSKIDVNKEVISKDLEKNWAVVSEAIQTILRRERIQKPYELLKDLTRGNNDITKNSIINFISKLPVSDSVKKELLSITPSNYLGNAKKC